MLMNDFPDRFLRQKPFAIICHRDGYYGKPSVRHHKIVADVTKHAKNRNPSIKTAGFMHLPVRIFPESFRL